MPYNICKWSVKEPYYYRINYFEDLGCGNSTRNMRTLKKTMRKKDRKRFAVSWTFLAYWLAGTFEIGIASKTQPLGSCGACLIHFGPPDATYVRQDWRSAIIAEPIQDSTTSEFKEQMGRWVGREWKTCRSLQFIPKVFAKLSWKHGRVDLKPKSKKGKLQQRQQFLDHRSLAQMFPLQANQGVATF